MLTRFLFRSFPALVLFIVVAAPAWAHDPNDHDARGRGRSYVHDRRDPHDRYDHRGHDRAQGLGHAVGDIFRYGTTDPYSSPGTTTGTSIAPMTTTGATSKGAIGATRAIVTTPRTDDAYGHNTTTLTTETRTTSTGGEK